MSIPEGHPLSGLPNRLKQARRAAGLTQRDAADLLNPQVHPSTLSDWERGALEPRLLHVYAAWELYGVRPMWLLLGAGRMR